MQVIMFSSVFNHHSMPFCDAMYKLCNGEFHFVETMEEEQQRRDLGYHSYERPYIISINESQENAEKVYDLAISADVMIAGVFPYKILYERLKRNKLTFLCQERIFKGNTSWVKKIKAWFFNMRRYKQFQNSPLYLLSIGKNTAKDYQSIGFYKNKSFLWAYFTEFKKYTTDELKQYKKKNYVEILFVGRLISLKHPEYVLKALQQLLDEGFNVHLSYVGTGEMQEILLKQTEQYKLIDYVDFRGSMSPEIVRKHMEKADVFVFTSNSMEGWGAVVNEAMNSGCAVIASESAGSVTTLIRDGVNGMVYCNDDYNEFYRKLKKVVSNHLLMEKMGHEAYKTISEEYNANIAAEHFYSVATNILENKDCNLYEEGIMSML